MLQTKHLLTTTVTARITIQQKEEIEKLARQNTATKSEMVRYLIVDSIKQNHEG